MVPKGYEEQMGILSQKHVKENMKWEMKKPSGSFLSNSREICRHFVFSVHQKTVS